MVFLTFFSIIYFGWSLWSFHHLVRDPLIIENPGQLRWFVIEISRVCFAVLMYLLWQARNSKNHAVWERLVIGFSASSALFGLYQAIVDLTFFNYPFWTHLFRASGWMFDANMQGFLSVLGYGLILKRVHSRKKISLIELLLILLYLSSLFASGSRAGFLWMIIITAGFLLGNLRNQSFSKKTLRMFAQISLAFLITVLLASQFQFILWKRILAEIYPEQYKLPEPLQELTGLESRAYHWRLVLSILTRHPWMGVGPGRYYLFSSKMIQANGDNRLPDNTLNVILDQLLDFGIPISLVLGTMCVLLIRKNWRKLHSLEKWMWSGLFVATCFTPIHHTVMTGLIWAWGSQSLFSTLHHDSQPPNSTDKTL